MAKHRIFVATLKPSDGWFSKLVYGINHTKVRELVEEVVKQTGKVARDYKVEKRFIEYNYEKNYKGGYLFEDSREKTTELFELIKQNKGISGLKKRDILLVFTKVKIIRLFNDVVEEEQSSREYVDPSILLLKNEEASNSWFCRRNDQIAIIDIKKKADALMAETEKVIEYLAYGVDPDMITNYVASRAANAKD